MSDPEPDPNPVTNSANIWTYGICQVISALRFNLHEHAMQK